MKKIIYNISIDWPLIIKIAFLFFCLISTIQKYLYKEGLVRTLHQGRNLCWVLSILTASTRYLMWALEFKDQFFYLQGMIILTSRIFCKIIISCLNKKITAFLKL